MWSTRKKKFTVGDVEFWKGDCQLPCNSPLRLILQADSTTLKITNHNNRCMGKIIHHKSFASDLCHCKAQARRIHHTLTNGGSTESYIYEYRVTIKDPLTTVTPTDLITAIRFSVSALKLHNSSINPDPVDIHSLRAGGGCL